MRHEQRERIDVRLEQSNEADQGSQENTMPQHGLENVRFPAELIGGGGGDTDALGVDHFPHDAAGTVGSAD